MIPTKMKVAAAIAGAGVLLSMAGATAQAAAVKPLPPAPTPGVTVKQTPGNVALTAHPTVKAKPYGGQKAPG